jgi:5-methylcytosine-specific restriction endonuclease McrBC regulatory subunit McrC
MRLELTEYGEAKRWIGTREQLAELHAAGNQWKRALGLPFNPLSLQSDDRGQPLVRAEGVVGFVKIAGLSVEVRPKFLDTGVDEAWRRALWAIIANVEDSPPLGESTAATTEPLNSLPDLMGWRFLESLNQGLQYGLPRGYVETAGELPALRGRLDLAALPRMLMRPHLLPCIYDVYDFDIPLNRLLRWAAALLSTSVQSRGLARRLETAVTALADVAAMPPGVVESEALRLPPTFGFLQPALDVARLLLRRQSLVHFEGREEASGFLWNSYSVYERFVKRLVRRSAATLGLRSSDDGQVLATGGRRSPPLYTYPDIRLLRQARTIVALDCKYKTFSKSAQPRNEDVYQVMAAGRVGDCTNVGLIYPSPTGARRVADVWRLSGTGMPERVWIVFVDLLQMGRRGGIRALIADLTHDIMSMVGTQAERSAS